MTKNVPKRAPSPAKNKVLDEKPKIVLPSGILISLERSPTSLNFKTHKTFVLHRFL